MSLTPALTRHSARLAALLAGLSLAGAAISAATVPAGRGALGAEALLNVNSIGELAASPSGAPFLRARELRSGGPAAAGSFVAANQTSAALSLRVRTRPHGRELDRALAVTVTAGKRVLFRGRLGGLRRWTTRAFPLAVERSVRIRFAVRVPRSAGKWENRMVESTVELQARPR